MAWFQTIYLKISIILYLIGGRSKILGNIYLNRNTCHISLGLTSALIKISEYITLTIHFVAPFIISKT